MAEQGRRIGAVQEPPLRYPRSLVERYGAKGGILLYVAQELPQIPQARMVVSEPGEPTDVFLTRASAQGVSYPRLYRSSAVAELVGYEGDFPTREVDDYETGHARVAWNPNNFSMYRSPGYYARGEREIVDEVRTSPQALKAEGYGLELPDEISVIAAERSPSRYTGTYIKHPNQEDVYLMVATENRFRQNFLVHGGRLKKIMGRDKINFPDDKVNEALERVTLWHDEIATLSEMDDSWSYQIEFGIDPPMLYQVRPFKPVESVDFQLGPMEEELIFPPTVIGVTPREGIEVQVVKFGDYGMEEPPYDGVSPAVVVCDMREVHWTNDFPNVHANLLGLSTGFLAHQDIKAMRRADVTGLFLFEPSQYDLRHGEFVNIVSDGTNLQVQTG